MTPAEFNERYSDLRIYDREGYHLVTLFTHRRCGCIVADPDTHEKVCFDPPVQLDPIPEPDPAKQKFINYQLGVKYS